MGIFSPDSSSQPEMPLLLTVAYTQSVPLYCALRRTVTSAPFSSCASTRVLWL